jgi:hypothetical protein
MLLTRLILKMGGMVGMSRFDEPKSVLMRDAMDVPGELSVYTVSLSKCVEALPSFCVLQSS